MTDLDAILNAPTLEAARELEEAGKTDRWWHIARHQCDMFAQNHSWAEAAVCLVDPRVRLRVAHARVLRGEDIAGQDLSLEEPEGRPVEEAGFWDVPLRLQPWEAREWDPGLLTRYHALGWGSSGRCGFPPERLECSMVLCPDPFRGGVGTVEGFGEWELSRWIRWVTTV